MDVKYLIDCLNNDKPLEAGALMDLVYLFKSNLVTSEQLDFISGSADTEKFKRDNNCSDDEFQAWMEYNERKGRYFRVTLSQFRNDTKNYVEKVIEDSTIRLNVRVLNKTIPLRLFERYWSFLVNADAGYIGFDTFETKRAALHNTIFKSVGLNRIDGRDTEIGREILRICDMLERTENASFDVELKKIIEQLRNENLILENDES